MTERATGSCEPNNLQSAQLELLDLSVPRKCAICGAIFEVEKRAGRPERFCSDACRKASATAQQRSWKQHNGRYELARVCAMCGTGFVVRKAPRSSRTDLQPRMPARPRTTAAAR